MTTYNQYLKALRKWFIWCERRGISPTFQNESPPAIVQHITDFILRGFREGYGAGHRVRSSTISATLSGIRHFFVAAGSDFPCGHPHIRMLLKGIGRLDTPVQHKAPVSIHQLELCLQSLNLALPSDQALWGVICLAFFFLLRRSEIASLNKGNFAWFALKAEDIAILDHSGIPTATPSAAASVHIRLVGSKTNQRGEPTQRMLNRSGHQFVCPVFGALCLLQARRSLPHDIPAAVYLNNEGMPRCVSSANLSKAIQRAAAQSGCNPSSYSAHSLRAGGATHMYRAGVDTLTIQFHGRWASDTFKQYTRLCKESVSALASRIISGSRHVNNLQ